MAPGTLPTNPAAGDISLDSGDANKLKVYDGGQWNTLRIKMIGSRVSVWLNDKASVDGQVLDNFYDRALPLVPKGAIELQTHGSEIRFRNIYVREIPPAEAKAALDKLKG